MRFSTLSELVEERNEEQRMKALQEAKRLSMVLRKHFPYEKRHIFLAPY